MGFFLEFLNGSDGPRRAFIHPKQNGA